MPDRFDPSADDIARDQARLIMERWTPFARMSRRLLADLLDRSVIVDLSGEATDSTSERPQWSEGADSVVDRLLGFVVVSGEVEFGPTTGARQKSARVGVYLRDDVHRAHNTPLRITASKDWRETHQQQRDRGVHIAPARVALLKASSVTPELAWSLQEKMLATDAVGSIKRLRGFCRPELILCDTNFRFRDHLEPLAHLLAGAIAHDLREPTAVVTFRADHKVDAVFMDPDPHDAERVIYYDDAHIPGADTSPKTKKASLKGKQTSAAREHTKFQRTTEKQLLHIDRPGKVDRAGKAKRTTLRGSAAKPSPQEIEHEKRRHVFVIDVDHSRQRSPGLAKDLNFDRIVYLTDRVPPAVPLHLRKQLDPLLFDGTDDAPYYCSFISSVLVAKDVQNRGRRHGAFEARRIRFARRREVEEPYKYLSRLDRDACVVPVDLAPLRKAWRTYQGRRRAKMFFDPKFDDGISAESISRWGRAVTNRRIGIALSGGGACAYRAGPLLASLKHHKVPVDVFAGLSGGALIGAFFCHSGFEGFATITDMGRIMQLTAPFAMLTTWPLEAVVDRLLGGTRVEDLEIRFAAVAVALPPDDPPMTQVVVTGTIGEAVRVSGTLPPVFAQTVKGGMRYTDGGAGTIVPAQVARDYGADIVLACNAIPGPAKSNPFPTWARPLLCAWQRNIDYFAWHSYFWRQASQRFLREADVAFEFEPESLSIFEAGNWMSSWKIVERAKQCTPQIEDVVNELRSKWQKLGDRLPAWLQMRIAAAQKRYARTAARKKRARARGATRMRRRKTKTRRTPKTRRGSKK